MIALVFYFPQSRGHPQVLVLARVMNKLRPSQPRFTWISVPPRPAICHSGTSTCALHLALVSYCDAEVDGPGKEKVSIYGGILQSDKC